MDQPWENWAHKTDEERFGILGRVFQGLPEDFLRTAATRKKLTPAEQRVIMKALGGDLEEAA